MHGWHKMSDVPIGQSAEIIDGYVWKRRFFLETVCEHIALVALVSRPDSIFADWANASRYGYLRSDPFGYAPPCLGTSLEASELSTHVGDVSLVASPDGGAAFVRAILEGGSACSCMLAPN